MTQPTRFGVYISGPGIVGKMLMMRSRPGPPWDEPIIFDTQAEADTFAAQMHRQRPYHFVRVHEYKDGDESLGELAAHPDGVT